MPSNAELVVAPEDPRSPVAAALIAAITAELDARYQDGGEGLFKPEDCLVPRTAFVIGRLGAEAVACGALRPIDAATAEIKRMYVVPACRGRGFGRLILDALERQARGFEHRRVILEPGTLQPEAIALYDRAGFARMKCFGPYVDNPRSVCFERRLTP